MSFCAEMGKKKIFLALKAELKQALLLHASSKTAEATRPLVMESGSGGAELACDAEAFSQVPPVDSPSATESLEGSGQLVQRKCRRLCK